MLRKIHDITQLDMEQNVNLEGTVLFVKTNKKVQVKIGDGTGWIRAIAHDSTEDDFREGDGLVIYNAILKVQPTGNNCFQV